MSDPDTSKPNAARIYDYWLGGTDNYPADRAAGEAVRRFRPDISELAVENKQFLTRAVSYLARQGVRQFLDVGAGLPTSPAGAPGAAPRWRATHEAAQAVIPGALVCYVDIDPIAVEHSRALLARDPGPGAAGRVVAVQGDMRDPRGVLSRPDLAAAGFRGDEPVGLILGSVLHFVEFEVAQAVATGFTGALAPGSYVVLSVGRGDDEVGDGFADTYNAQRGSQVYNFSLEQVAALFSGLDLVPPGIVPAPRWRPEPPGSGPATDRAATILAGVGRRRAGPPPRRPGA